SQGAGEVICAAEPVEDGSREQVGVPQGMTDAEAGDRIHHESSAPAHSPSGAAAPAYQIGKIAGPPRPADLHGPTGSLTQAAGLVESGNEVSCWIPADCLEVRDRPSNVCHRETVIGRPGAGCESGAGVDLT